MKLEEGISYPSLWLPRFDIVMGENGLLQRYGLESVYSVLKKGPGVTLDHETTIRTLIDKILNSHMVQEQGFIFDVQAFVIEWVRRDLLNIIFGNSDNHGRNTSFMKAENRIILAPIYDFAPMKADPEGIPCSMKWSRELEIGGEYNFQGIAQALSDLVPEDLLLAKLRETSGQLIDLKTRLIERGVPTQIITMPAIGFDYIAEKLSRWRLL